MNPPTFKPRPFALRLLQHTVFFTIAANAIGFAYVAYMAWAIPSLLNWFLLLGVVWAGYLPLAGQAVIAGAVAGLGLELGRPLIVRRPWTAMPIAILAAILSLAACLPGYRHAGSQFASDLSLIEHGAACGAVTGLCEWLLSRHEAKARRTITV